MATALGVDLGKASACSLFENEERTGNVSRQLFPRGIEDVDSYF